jgi:hypothetical protein
MFYYLVQSYGSQRQAVSLRVRASNRSLHSETLDVVEETVARLGSTCSEAQIMRAVERECADRGLPLHSTGLVRRRVRRHRQKDIARRLGINADLVLDACALEVNTCDEQGREAAASFTAVIDVKTGAILSHRVSQRCPSLEVSRQCIFGALEHSGSVPDTIKQTPAVVPLLDRELAGLGLTADNSPGRYVKSGMPLTVTLGAYIGRIPLWPRNRPYAPFQKASTESLGTISAVVKVLVEAHNQDVMAASAILKHDPRSSGPLGNSPPAENASLLA